MYKGQPERRRLRKAEAAQLQSEAVLERSDARIEDLEAKLECEHVMREGFEKAFETANEELEDARSNSGLTDDGL